MSFKIPPHVEKIIPYEAGKPVEALQRELGLSDIVKLASNENPLGPPEACVTAMHQAIKSLHRYPDDSYYQLKEKIGKKFKVNPSNIIMGAGSSDIILGAAKGLLGKEDYTVISDQSFILYWLAVQSVNGNLIRVPLQNYTYDLEAMAKAIDERVKLVYIANPNNPTGTMVTGEEMDKFMDSIPEDVVVVYDEAYREYIDDPDFPDPMKYYERGDNIIIARTFSKIYGLAGLRVGYGIAKEEIIKALLRVRSSFNVNSIANAAALAALDADDYVEKAIKVNNEGKAYITAELEKLGMKIIPSVTNFILVDTDYDTTELYTKLQRLGVIVRPMKAFGMPNAFRITIGLKEENEKLINALKKVI